MVADGGLQSETPLSRGNGSQCPQAPGHSEPCESHQPEPLVIRDNAWPSVPKDIPGSPETRAVLPSALAFCPPGAAFRGWDPPGDSFLPAAGSGGSGHTFPVAAPSLPGPHPAGQAAPFSAHHRPQPFGAAPLEGGESGGWCCLGPVCLTGLSRSAGHGEGVLSWGTRLCDNQHMGTLHTDSLGLRSVVRRQGSPSLDRWGN